MLLFLTILNTEWVQVNMKNLDDKLRSWFLRVFSMKLLGLVSIPSLLIPKNGGSSHICVDSRAINKITVCYHFHIFCIDDLLDHIGVATMFSKLDLKSEYH